MKEQTQIINEENKFLSAIKLLSETCNLDSEIVKVLTIKYAYKTVGKCCTDEYFSVLVEIRNNVNKLQLKISE